MARVRRSPPKRRTPARPKRRPSVVRPTRFRTVTPYLFVDGAEKAVDFYQKAFGAREEQREHSPDGKIIHSRLRIGDSLVMLADIFPGSSMISPATTGSTAVTIHLTLRNVDAVWAKAVAAGATVVRPLEDMFWGDRYGQLRDPFGHSWSLSQPLRMSAAEKEAKRRAAMEMFAQGVPSETTDA